MFSRAVPADVLELSVGPTEASVTAQLLLLPNVSPLPPPHPQQKSFPKLFSRPTGKGQRLKGLFLGDPNLYQCFCLEPL